MSSGLDENQLGGREAESGQLNDIKGYWNHEIKWNETLTDSGYQFNWDFNEVNVWEGQIILYKDGWFEGIVIDPSNPGIGDMFVFGAYFPDLVMNLLKVTPSRLSYPFIFRGKKDAKGYDGQFSSIGLFGEELYGNNHIVTQESEKQDTSDLELRIKTWKRSMIGDENYYIYINTIRMRSQMLEIIKRNAKGEKFSRKEVAEIKRVTDPIKDDVLSQTVNHAQTMARKLVNPTLEDDDIPF